MPLVLALATAVAAVHRGRQGDMRTWLVLAMVLYAGAQLHDYLAPKVYSSPFLAHADILSFAFAGLVAVGGIIELRRIAAERAALLAVERENNRRLTELATMKADFTAMVVHELGGPLAAVRRLTEMLEAAEEDPEVQVYALRAIEGEVDTLETLVADVRTSAAAERGDFGVQPRPVSLAGLLIDAEGFAYTLPGDHPVEIIPRPRLEDREEVWADPERIGQVLRNLLSNAAKYSPEGVPIELRVERGHRRVRIEVADHGPGIHPDDARRIFEKFGRGRDRSGKKIAGVGLGLSRRIMQAHGGELTLDSTPGEGATFGFELDVVKREER